MNSSSKKRRVSRIESSDEELSPSVTPENIQIEEDNDLNCRKSSRIKQRQNKVFQKPTRDEIWDKIPSSSEKDLSRITPTKKINNFTKVFSTYNAESYDLFNDDFIDDEEEIDFESTSISTDSEEEDRLEKKKRRKKNKIKNRRKRLKFESSSSDDGVDKTIKDLKDTDEKMINEDDVDSDTNNSISTQDKGGNDKGDNISLEGDNSFLAQCKANDPDVEGGNTLLAQEKANHSDVKGGNSSQTENKGDNLREESEIENKGDNSEIAINDSDDECRILFSHSKNKNIVKSDSESDINDERRDDSEENSEESDDDWESDNLSRTEKQLAEKQSRFQHFKAKLKEKQRRLNMTVALKQK